VAPTVAGDGGRERVASAQYRAQDEPRPLGTGRATSRVRSVPGAKRDGCNLQRKEGEVPRELLEPAAGHSPRGLCAPRGTFAVRIPGAHRPLSGGGCGARGPGGSFTARSLGADPTHSGGRIGG
jgi:hypothetical protein